MLPLAQQLEYSLLLQSGQSSETLKKIFFDK